MRWYVAVLRKFAVFNGRASRAEFWMFWLVHTVIRVSLLLISIQVVEAFSLLFLPYQVALLVPTVSVSVRRLHDTNRSGWWFSVYFFPVVGGVALLALASVEGDPGENEFGPPPEGAKAKIAKVVGAGGETLPECPHCGAQYDLADYRPDTEHIYCSTCGGEIERSPE